MIKEKSIVANDYHVPHLKFRFKATAPASITKTKRDYFWLLPAQLDSVVPLIR